MAAISCPGGTPGPSFERRKLWKRNWGWKQQLFWFCRSVVFCLIITPVQVRVGKLNEGGVGLGNSKFVWPDRVLAGLLYFLSAFSSGLHSVTDVFRNPSFLRGNRTNFCKVTLFCYYISNANQRRTKMAPRMRIAARSFTAERAFA